MCDKQEPDHEEAGGEKKDDDLQTRECFGEEEADEGEGDDDFFLEDMFYNCGGDQYNDEAPDGSRQSVYWTDGTLIVRTKWSAVWNYCLEDE